MSKLLVHMTTWMNLKCILLTKRSKTQKTAYCMIIYITVTLWKRKNFEDRNRVNGCQGLEVGTGDNSQRDMRELLE